MKSKTTHRKAVTAVLLENQEKFLREEQAFGNGINLMEGVPPTNQQTLLVLAVDSVVVQLLLGPVAGFDPVLISLIRRSMPNLVAYDLAGVQPMSGPNWINLRNEIQIHFTEWNRNILQ